MLKLFSTLILKDIVGTFAFCNSLACPFVESNVNQVCPLEVHEKGDTEVLEKVLNKED